MNKSNTFIIKKQGKHLFELVKRSFEQMIINMKHKHIWYIKQVKWLFQQRNPSFWHVKWHFPLFTTKDEDSSEFINIETDISLVEGLMHVFFKGIDYQLLKWQFYLLRTQFHLLKRAFHMLKGHFINHNMYIITHNNHILYIILNKV